MFKRKSLSVVTFALLVILSVASVRAQVTVLLHQPPPNRLNVEDLWKIDLTNNTGKTISVKLRGTATESSEGLIFEGSSSVFDLAPGFTKVSIPEISPLDVSYANEKYKEIVTRTGSVPAGDYQVCISVLYAKSGEELGKDCIQQQVAHPTPPQLISPADGANATEEYPIFTWMPPVPITPGHQASYELKIVEVLNNQSPIDAMQSNPAWFEKKGIKTTSLKYSTSARAFEKGKEYAWQVTAEVEDKNWVIGKSGVWRFTYKEQPEGKPLIIKNISEGDILASMVVIIADVGERTDIVECSFYVRWDNEWLLIAKDSEFEDEWWTEVDTYAWVTLGNRDGELKVVAKTKKGKILESEPIKIIVSN